MSGDTVDQLYNAVHADGAVTGTREEFRKFFLAPGKQGYQNRLQFYNDLHARGAVSSGTYEEFAQRMGLHARSRSKAVQQAVAYKTQVPNNFGGLDTQTAGMSWLQRQNMTQKQKAASEKRKAASRGNVVAAGEAVTGQQAATPHVVKRNPNKFFTETQLGNSDLALDYGDNVEGRIHKMEDDKRNAAALLNSQLTKDSFDQIDKAFAEMSGKEIQDNMNMTTDPNDAMGNLFGVMRGANQKYGTDAVIKAYEEALPTIFGSDKSRKAISEQARKLGMDEEEFTQKYMLPNIEKTIHDRLVNEGIPKSDAEYFARGVLSGIAGNIFTRGVMTKQGREIMNEGTEKYLSDLDTRIEKDGVFSKAGLAKYGNIGMGMASDIAAFAGAGKIAGGMMSGLGTGVNLLTKTPLGKRLLGWAATSASGLTKRYGVEGAARIANFASNNKTWLGTLLTDGAKGTLRSGLTLGNYGAMQYATGEGYDKLEDGDTNNWFGGLLNSYSDEFKTGLKFGVVGAVGSTVGRNVGITGVEASNLQKITNGLKKATVSTGAFVAESLAFRTEQMAEEWAKNHNINFTDNFIQGACENMAMKLGGGHIKQFSPKNILRSMTMATGDRGLTLTDTEKKIFLENTDAKNLVAACEALEPNHKTQGEGYTAEDTSGMKYEDRSKTMEKKKVNLSERDAQGNAVGKLQQFLDNKEIPLKLRMKVSAALGGTMGRTIPRASRIVLEQGEKGKYMVKEYSESGELIDAKEHSTYDSAEGDRQNRYLKRQDRDFKDEYLNAMDVTTQEDKMNVMELVAKDNGFESVEDMIHESALRNSQGDDSLDKKIKADYKRRREEYAGTKAKKVLDIQREVSEEYGVDLDKAMDKDFQLRTDQENEAIEEFKKRLRGENTDKNDEAQNNAVARQDGADLSEQTELEDSEKFTESAKSVNDRQASATEAWMEMVKDNPDLDEWMKSNPNASVEELRENFGDDVADAYMELSNAQAMRDGFMQNTGSKIEDAVRNQVEQAKFTGTMQGMGSEDRIFVFIDSAGNEYTLVGGDVVFDKTDFRFKTGESGLIILRDKDGNIVQDKRLEDLYFTNYYSYEEYADVIRKRLQEQKTAEIQSTETPLPEAPKEEAPAEETKEEPTTQEESKSNEKEKSSDSNKTTDTALPQSEESSSNDKGTTKSSDLQGGNETLTFKDGTEAPKNYDLNDIPMDDNGEPIYESVPKERTVQDLFGKLDDGNLAREYSEMRVSEAEKELKEAKKKEPKMGTKINEYLKKKQEYEDRVKAAEDKVAYWESVKEDIEKLTHTTTEELKEAKEELDGTVAREEFKKTFDETQPADGVALAAKFVADAKVTPESFKKETGMGAAEQKSFVGMIAKEEKGGKSIERLGEDLVYLDNDEYGGVYFHGDSNDARSAIISALTGAKSRKGLREMAEPDMERAVSERAQMRDEAYNERYGMNYEEYLLYSEQEIPHILGNLNNFDEQKYLQDKAVDIINQLDKEYGKVTGENDSRGEESVHVEGDKVLSEERPNDGGGGESPEKHGGGEKDERRSNTPDAPLHETPSRREGRLKPADPSDVAEGIREAAEQFHQERVEKARKAYEEAKASGDTSETKRTKDEYRKALDDKLKAQGIGLVERRKTIAKEMGEEPKVEEPKEGKKHWDSLTPTEKVEKADADPLTEEEIRSDEENKELAAAAIAYLNGDKSLLNQIAYLKIYGNVRNRHEDVPGNSGTEDKTQLATSGTGSGEGLGLEPGRSGGGSAEPLDSGTGGEAAPGKRESGTNSEGGPDTAAGEGGDIKGEGNTPGLDGVPAGSGGRERGGTAGSKGNLGSGRGRGSGNGPSKPDGKRKPAAKQGTTFPNSKGSDVKKETNDAKAAMKAAFAEFKKRGKNGSASISLIGMNNEQIEYLPELMKATGRYGIAVMREGIYKAKEWFDNIREAISDDMKDIGFKDADIDEYIREMWHMPWEMDGETHKIGEWASIKGYANLRESLKEPLRKKFDKQVLAEATEVKVGDRKNIEETLPFLLPQQQDDVLKAETQFFDESHKDKAHAGGKGYMFTNGTGTGKTYTGLGIIKRMTKQGKGRILIITPSQQKVKDWINDGKNLCLDIRDLDDWSKEHGSTATNEKGEGVVITTFANFGTNKALLEDQFDAVIYDESHRIMENKEAKETARSRQHYMLTNRNERYALMRLEEVNPDCMKMRGLAEDFENARKKETARIKAEYEKNNPSAGAADVRVYMAKNTPRDIQSFSMADKAKHPELGKIYEDYRKARDYYINNVKPKLEKQAKESVDKTKVVFLSATPFNTRENIEYAEGYLFSYPERNESGQSGKAQFFLEHFGAGYKFRYNRLERSTANAEALAKQEVAFSDWLQNDLCTMSGRIIDSPYDYSRDFPTVSVEHARDFNEACEEISRDDVFGAAYREVLGDYNYGSALFETMKVAAMLPRLREHIAAGRKVVVFHRRVSSKEPLQAPFGMILGENAEKAIKKLPKDKQPEARTRLNELRSKYSELLKWEQTLDFSMPREQLAKAFGEDNVLYFSGQESSKVKNEAVKQFNDDNSGKNIIVIQEASGKEGISLHDTTGKHQRVCITLALPQSPITALQIEGRTYRIGNESNAIFEYPVLGLVSEYNLFASKFNQQVSTTENLALGSQARNLRESFARGIEEHSGYVPLDQQGVGGKDFDKADESDSDPYDNAILDYYTNQKLNRNNREGVDYFPTPEPLGYKIVEWANIGEGDSVLEPSAGHGAIARYAPQSNELVAIEPSMSLFAKLQMKAGGLGRKFQNDTFENYYIGNKHDTVVMNPPFGKAGATAIAHAGKAFGHLEEGGRVVAIIPRGAMDKKFDKWYEGEKSAVLRAEIDLPDIVFEQAGTKVRCRVVVIDKITDSSLRARAEMTQVDLNRHYDKIEDFFEDLRDVEVPERIIDQQAKQMKKSKATVSELRNMRGVYDVSLDRDGIEVGARGVRERIEFKENESADAFKKRMAGLYDQFAQNEKRCANYNMDASAVYGELKDLTCKLADMTEDEMRRYLTSKNSNSYDEGGVRFRKGEGTGKYAKESRIVPQDVDKEVSSQIEKKFDEDIEKAFPDEKERRSAESVIYDFAERYSYMKTSEIIDNVNEWKENDGRERRNGGENTSRGHYTAVRFKSAMLASEREMEYRRIRANRIKSLFGIEGSGRQIPIDGISKAFEETKGRDSRGREILFRASLDIARRLGTKFYLEEAGPKASHAGVTDTNREIRFFLDGLTRTATKAEEFNVTIVHELLHQSVNGAINLVKKGKAEGFLSEKQIDGAKTILDIYNKVKGDKERFKENTYGLKSEYEFAAQMADQRQRQALDTDIFERVVSAARELVKKGDYSLWQRVKDALGKLFGTSDLKKMDKALNNIMDDFKEVVHDYSMDDIEQEGFGYKVNDPEEIERLEKEPKVKVYRAMQVIDGKLYPPMAAKVRGRLVEPRELGEWERADENPDLAIPDIDKKTGKQKVDKKTGELKWKFKLDKGGKDAKGKKLGDVPAAYNPYWHTSRSPLNDQFSSAYKRPNLRVVEVEIPESELTSGYKAERAKDAVGEMAWHSGPVSSKLPKEKERKVILSRWDKPVRVLSDAEAADKIAEMLKGEDIEIPDNTITPGLKAELIKRGLKVTETDEVKEWNNTLRFRNEGEMTPEERREERRLDEHRSTVEKAAEKLNTDVTICESIDDVTNAEARAAIERGERVKAWYDTRTGEVHLYLPNVTDKYDAQKSIAHEVIGHKGMRGLLGEDGYRTMLRRIYTHLSDAEAREVNERMMRNGWDFYTAMDEWVADKAEESVWQPQEYPKYIGLSNLWSHIKKSVTEAMHKAGYYINPNVDDVKYWLWESKRALRDGNAETEMRRNAFLWKLGHGKMNDDVVMGEYTGEGEAEDKTSKPLYRNTLDFNKNDTPTNAATKETIERELTSRSFRRTEAWTDDKNGYRVFQSEMAKGVDDFNSSMDAYHGAINQSSKVAEKQKNFERRELREMEEAIKKPVKLLGGGQKGYEALNLYLFMKSGLERNRVLLARDVADKIDGKIRKLNKELLAKDPTSGIIIYNGVEHFRDEFHAEKDYLTTLLEQGQIDLHQYYSELDRFIKTFEFAMTGDNVVDAKIAELNKWYKDNIGDKYDPNNNDYSGISSIVQHRQNGAFSDGAIIDAVMQTENTMGGADEVDNLWSAIKPVTNYGLECDFKNGIISKAAAERAKKMFNWYVPMRGFDQETMEDSYSYMRSDSRIESKSLATAKGRTTLATSPLGTAAAMASKAIARGEDNANKQRAYRLVNAWLKNHTETDANGQQKLTEVAPAMISDVWFERKYDSLGNEYWEVASPKITEKMTSEEIRQEIEDFKDDMKAKEAQGGATKTLQKGVFAKPFEAGAHKAQNVVNVWIGGKMKQIIFTGNPRPAQALNGELKSDVRQLKLMRMMAGMFTSYNVTFSISNLSRDTLFANNNIANKESAAYYKKFVTLQTRLLGGMGLGMATMNSSKHIRGEYFNMWANYKKGIPPKSKLEKLFYEFMDNGGKTGFVTTKTINNFETEIRKAATGGNVWDFAGKCFKAIPEVIEGLNERSENLNRFACYATSRMMGRSIMRSVTDAKEVSTNFNRRGLGSKAYDVPEASSFGKFTGVVADWCKRCYLFFNAGMQSLRLLSTNLKNHPIRTSAYTVGIPMVFGGMLIPMLNQWLADDDGETYANLPDWDRRNNICLYMGKGKWFKVPLPIELRAFYGLGDLTRSYFDKRLRSEKNIVVETIAQLSQILPWDFMGDGNDITTAAWPDVLKPIVQVYRNKDWTGKPIYKDYDYMKNDPEYTKVYKGEFEPLVNMSKFINEMSGGTSVSKGSADGLWNNPAVWSNIINGYFGGAGSDAMRVYRLGERAVTWNGKDFSVREVPMLKALISTPTEKTLYYRALNKYAASLEEAKKLEHDIKKWKDNLEDPEISMKYHSVVRKGSPELQKLAIIGEAEYLIKQARKVMNDKSTPEEDKDKIQLLIDKKKMEVVKELEDLE